MLKAQVLTGGRGQGWRVKLANSPGKRRSKAREIPASHQANQRKVLVAKPPDRARFVHLSVVLDRAARQPLVRLSAGKGRDRRGRQDESGRSFAITLAERPAPIRRARCSRRPADARLVAQAIDILLRRGTCTRLAIARWPRSIHGDHRRPVPALMPGDARRQRGVPASRGLRGAIRQETPGPGWRARVWPRTPGRRATSAAGTAPGWRWRPG